MPSMSKLSPVYRNRASLDLEKGQSSQPFQSSPAPIGFHTPCSALLSANESEGQLTESEPMDLDYYGSSGDTGDTEPVTELDSDDKVMMGRKWKLGFSKLRGSRVRGKNMVPIPPPKPDPVDLGVGGLLPMSLTGLSNFLKLLEANGQLTAEKVTQIMENLTVRWANSEPMEPGGTKLIQYFNNSPIGNVSVVAENTGIDPLASGGGVNVGQASGGGVIAGHQTGGGVIAGHQTGGGVISVNQTGGGDISRNQTGGGDIAGNQGGGGGGDQANQAGNRNEQEEDVGRNFLVEGLAKVTENLFGGMSTTGKIVMATLVLSMIVCLTLLMRGK